MGGNAPSPTCVALTEKGAKVYWERKGLGVLFCLFCLFFFFFHVQVLIKGFARSSHYSVLSVLHKT